MRRTFLTAIVTLILAASTPAHIPRTRGHLARVAPELIRSAAVAGVATTAAVAVAARTTVVVAAGRGPAT